MLAVGVAIASTAFTEERVVVLDAAAPFVNVDLAGSPVRLRVDFAAHRGVMLNPATAQRLGLRRTGRMLMHIGPLKVRGEIAHAPLKFAGRSVATRIVWYPRPAADDADGLIGPASLPVELVRLALRPRSSTDRTLSVQASTKGDFGVHTPLQIGARVIAVEFSPHVAETRAPAATAAVLATALGGRLSGPERPVALALGVSRPARRMQLAQPLDVAGFSIRELLVRIGDFRGSHDLPPDGDAPEDEVRVLARDAQHPRFVLRIGADHLAACSEIAYAARTSTVQLSCTERGADRSGARTSPASGLAK